MKNLAPTPTVQRITLGVVLFLLALLTGCDAGPGKLVAPGVLRIAEIDNKDIVESSGVVASRRFPGVLWTHNDGGGAKKQVLYAIDRSGRTRAAIPVVGEKFHDWEDIAIDDSGHLYLGDIGNNDTDRDSLVVYQVDEPDPAASGKEIRPTREWKLKFPGASFNCESLFIWQGYGYVVSKVFDKARAQVFRFPLKDSKKPVTLELVATTPIQSPATGTDISADGKRLAIVAKDGAYVFRIDGDVARVGQVAPTFSKCKDEHIEGCCFVADGLLATSENRDIFLFTDPAFREP